MTRLSSPTSHDSKTDLLEAAKAVVQERNEKAGQAAARRMQPEVRKRVGVLSLLGLGGLLLLVPAARLAGRAEAASTRVRRRREASVRLSMLREQQRVADFLQRNGRLPATLSEAGVTCRDWATKRCRSRNSVSSHRWANRCWCSGHPIR